MKIGNTKHNIREVVTPKGLKTKEKNPSGRNNLNVRYPTKERMPSERHVWRRKK